MSVGEEKYAAAQFATGLVKEGMTVGLGSGTTAEIAVRLLGARVHNGLRIVGVPTSEHTAQLAESLGIPLVPLDDHNQLDLVIDGADEVDPLCNLVKGHGGALLREKLVAKAAKRCIIIVDSSKLVTNLGQLSPIPLEVIPFGWTTTMRRLQTLGLFSELRGGDHPYETDGHNYILDCHASSQIDFASTATADSIKLQTGVVEHGLFLGIATNVVVGKPGGDVEVMEPPFSNG